MVWQAEQIFGISFYLSSIEESASDGVRTVCAVYEENGKGIRFDVNVPRSGRPSDFDRDALNNLIHGDSRQSTLELVSTVDCDQSIIFAILGQN